MSLFSRVKSAVSSVASSVKNAVSSTVSKVVSAVSSAANAVKNVASNIVSSATSAVSKAITAVKSAVTSSTNNNLSNVNQKINKITEITSQASVNASSALDAAASKLTTSVANANASVQSNITAIADAAKPDIQANLANAQDAITNAVTAAVTTDQNLPSTVSSVADELAKPTTPVVSAESPIISALAALFGVTGLPDVVKEMDKFLASYTKFYLALVPDIFEPNKATTFLASNVVSRVVAFVVDVFSTAAAINAPTLAQVRRGAFLKNPTMIPSESDIVRFQLREVFDTAFRGEQLIPYPSDAYFKSMAQVGFDKFWSESFWAAHWELPSVGQAFEMFQRLRKGVVSDGVVFDRSSLKKLLTRLDILPAFHDKLIEIAYVPFTRVDVRRMYKLGVLDFKQMTNAYMDIGYSPEKAAQLAEFTKRDVDDDDVTFIKSRLITAYESDIISEKELDTYVEPTFRDKGVYGFFKNVLNREKVAKSKKSVKAKAAAKDKTPTLTNVKKWFSEGLIDESRMRQELKDLKYSDSDIEVFVRQFKAELK